MEEQARYRHIEATRIKGKRVGKTVTEGNINTRSTCLALKRLQTSSRVCWATPV
jgi:hypothetical protein